MQEKEKSAGKGQKKNWFQGLQSEFKKIVWVDNSGRNKSFSEVRITVIVCQKQNGMLFILIQGMKTK